jgi:membrane-associated phospholipid phosphatase
MDVSRVAAVRHTRLPWIAGQVLLVVLGIVVYFRIRGLTEASYRLARAHAEDLLHLERILHIDVERAVQKPVESSEAVETLANWVYIWGHWPVLIATLAWLLWRHRPQFLRLRDAMMVSGGLGMIVFVSYPMAPPRLVGPGYVDTVTESSTAYRYLQPPAFVNQYAAMPSLHVGWDLLAGLAIFSATSSILLRVVACAMPTLMAWAVIATANHYVLDVVAGVALVMVGHVVALALERRRTERARRGGPPAPPDPSTPTSRTRSSP